MNILLFTEGFMLGCLQKHLPLGESISYSLLTKKIKKCQLNHHLEVTYL